MKKFFVWSMVGAEIGSTKKSEYRIWQTRDCGSDPHGLKHRLLSRKQTLLEYVSMWSSRRFSCLLPLSRFLIYQGRVTWDRPEPDYCPRKSFTRSGRPFVLCARMVSDTPRSLGSLKVWFMKQLSLFGNPSAIKNGSIFLNQWAGCGKMCLCPSPVPCTLRTGL